MIELKHTPKKDMDNVYEITGNDIDELIDYCLLRIREKSKEGYKNYLRTDLIEKSKSIIDQHAGMGTFYIVYLKK